MPAFESPPPFERPEQLLGALSEQGVSPEESADLLPALQRLAEWPAPQPSAADTQRLLRSLVPALFFLSPVRAAIREHQQHRLAALLSLARAQVSLFKLSFWLASALIALIGAGVVMSDITTVASEQALILRVSGPLLAYLGAIVAFRGKEARVLELELVCLPSPLQLALARLLIVLGYDIGLGLALSFVLWAGGSQQVLALTLSWLMPLLLVVGLALLLSLRLSIQAAASLAYVSWVIFVAINGVSSLQVLPLAPLAELLPGCIGLVLLAITLSRLRLDMHHLLPRV